MKKIFLTIFLFTYLFSSVGYGTVLHFCAMKKQIVEKANRDQCCRDMQENPPKEHACCMANEASKQEPMHCCAATETESMDHMASEKSGFENNCCKEIDVYNIVENSLKNIGIQIEAIQLSGKISFSNEFEYSDSFTITINYNPSIDHLNRPLLI